MLPARLATGPGSLSLDNFNGAATINVTSGNHVINTPLVIAANGLGISLPNANATLSLNANITSSGGLGLLTAGKLLILPGANAAKITELSLPGSTNAWTGQLDLTNNALIVQSTSPLNKSGLVPNLKNQILSGKNNGAWDGNGITSSLIPSTPNTSLALADNADLHLTSFRGKSLNDNALIIVMAHNGDATLDSKVDALDLNILAAHWQQQSGALWSAGDFTGDGKVDALDLNVLAANWQFSSALEALAAALPPGMIVPEPTSLLFLVAAWLPLWSCRKRLRTHYRG